MPIRWRISSALLLALLAAGATSLVSKRIWIARVEATVRELEARADAGADRAASLPIRPCKVLLQPGGGFALVFEPPLLAWHTRVLRPLLGSNDVVVEYRDGKVHTIWWGLD